jgi:hypothetical protein
MLEGLPPLFPTSSLLSTRAGNFSKILVFMSALRLRSEDGRFREEEDV